MNTFKILTLEHFLQDNNKLFQEKKKKKQEILNVFLAIINKLN